MIFSIITHQQYLQQYTIKHYLHKVKEYSLEKLDNLGFNVNDNHYIITTGNNNNNNGNNTNYNYEIKQTGNLDYSLINGMNEGYFKDLLQLLIKNENGELDDSKVHISVPAILGIIVNETGTYNGTKIPISYLPYDSVNHKVIWNESYKGIPAKNMTLTNFNDNDFAKMLGNLNALCSWVGEGFDSINDRTMFCIQQWNTKYSNGKYKPSQDVKWNVAKISSSTDLDNQNRTEGELHYYPDILLKLTDSLNMTLNEFLTENAKAKLTTTEIDCIFSTVHNRGIHQLAFGIAYDTAGGFSNYCDLSKKNDNDCIEALTTLGRAIENFKNDYSNANITGIYDADICRLASVAILAKQEDWYFTSKIKDTLNKNKDSFEDVWHKLYKAENSLTFDEIMNKYINSKITLNTSEAIYKSTGIKVTTDECNKVYRQSNYDNCAYFNKRPEIAYGCVFKIHKQENGLPYRTNIYKNKYDNGDNPILISSYDFIASGHIVSCTLGGEYLYSLALAESGVTTVDPTNPETYKIQKTEQKMNTIVSTFKNDELPDNMKLANININQISPVRMALLKTASEIVEEQIPYKQDHSNLTNYDYIGKANETVTKLPNVLDCTSFCIFVTRLALAMTDKTLTNNDIKTKVPDMNTFGMRTGYNNTTYTIANNTWRWIPKDELKSGDMIFYNGNNGGHAVIYLSGDINLRPFLTQAHGTGKVPSIKSTTLKYSGHTIYESTEAPDYLQTDVWYCFRNIALENLEKKLTDTYVPASY